MSVTLWGFWVDIGRSLREALYMFWDTLWALVLGFGLSGAVQAFVPRDAMQRRLGDHRPASIARATLYGVASSSCSYAASAMARSLFARGADFLAAMVFMFASTNLVVELGTVLAVLIGGQFVAAEFVGGTIMIVLLVSVGGLWLRGRAVNSAAAHVQAETTGSHQAADEALESNRWRQRIRTPAGWADAASYTMGDLTMLRKELFVGFGVAGLISMLVPTRIWSDLFIPGHGFWTSLENAVVGPFVALLSFVCSIGNVPLAAALWKGGVSFGGVLAFVFADLITLPLVLIYRKQYGGAMAFRMLGVFWAVMSAAGLASEYLFKALGWIPTDRPGRVVGDTVRWNPTTVLDIVALAAFATLYWLHRNRERLGGGAGYAKDPVCSMQVETAHAPASLERDGQPIYFCSAHCARRFEADPARYIDGPASEGGEGWDLFQAAGVDLERLDPVCGMTVDPMYSPAQIDHHGCTISFCCPGCAERFHADPERYLPEDAIDPICGMTVHLASAKVYRRGNRSAIWFCSVRCAETWDRTHSAEVHSDTTGSDSRRVGEENSS